VSFSSDLRRELSGWVRDGLVQQNQADAIQARYPVDSASTTSLLLPTIYILGAALIGGGAISFVAANWDSIPIWMRIGLLVATMLSCEITGFVLWKLKESRENLGQALIVIGALVFGASIFLIAQMYHLRGEPHGAFGMWALGALSVAYATFSSPAMLLVCFTGLVWSIGQIDAHPHEFCWYPFVLCLVCFPFLRRHSALALTGLLLAGGTAAATAAGTDSGQEWPVYATLMALGALARGLGLWLAQRESTEAMASPALSLGGLVLLPIYLLSFHDGPAKTVVEHLWTAEGWLWTVLLGVVYLGGGFAWFGALSLIPAGSQALKRKHLAMLGAAILVTLGITAGNEVILMVTANLALLMVAGALLWEAVVEGQRREFWLGLGLFVLLIVSRFVEWDTHLMVKSAVFILCGIGVTIGGVRFEKSLKGRGTT
jgi:uncharacterized membrane protein